MVKFYQLKILLTALILGLFCGAYVNTAWALDYQNITQLLNLHRQSLGKPDLKEEAKICDIAQNRAPSVAAEIYGGYMHAGFYTLNLPFWATEIIINYSSDQGAVNWWLNSPIHSSIIRGDYQYACIRCAQSSCSGVFTNFTPKG